MNGRNEFNQILDEKIEDWKSAKWPAYKILQGKYCQLEPMMIDKHAVQLFHSLSLDNKGESWTYLPYGPFDSYDEFRVWLERNMAYPDTFLYVILDINRKLPIGISGYLRITPEHGSIEVGHLHFSKLLKRTRAATEAMYLMMHFAFDELGYRRYEWKCNALNQPSRDAAERFGFKFEGIFRQHNIFKERNRDTAWFSIIDKEWPTLKRKNFNNG